MSFDFFSSPSMRGPPKDRGRSRLEATRTQAALSDIAAVATGEACLRTRHRCQKWMGFLYFIASISFNILSNRIRYLHRPVATKNSKIWVCKKEVGIASGLVPVQYRLLLDIAKATTDFPTIQASHDHPTSSFIESYLAKVSRSHLTLNPLVSKV